MPLLPRESQLIQVSRPGWARRVAPRRPKLLYTRALVSRPGAPHQNFHFDQEMGPRSAILPSYRLFNVFVPLVDIEPDADGTQFLPGSHLGGMRNTLCAAAIERSGSVAKLKESIPNLAPISQPSDLCLNIFHRILDRF